MKKITQIKIITLSVLLIFSLIASAKLNKPTIKNNLKTKNENRSKFNYKLNISPKIQKKVGGLLLKRTLSKRFAIDAMKKGKVLQQKSSGKLDREIIAVYLTRKPTKLFDEKLESLGINRKNKIWIPAVANHKYGFAIYIAPIDKIETLAKMPEIMRIESLEQTYNGQLDKAIANSGINALAVRGRFDYYGQGLTVGIIDTGYDVGNPDLPDPVEKWSYSSGNLEVNADVTDTNSGHGTYIAGCIVGNGTLASANNLMDMNGIAPSSQVHVVKADTVNEGIRVFSSVTLIQALNDLAESNCVDVINMSLGGWDAYHDGSSPLDQAVDYVSVEKGIPVFCAAGNLANKKQHAFFEIEKFDAKELKFTVSVSNYFDFHSVAFNLVWADGYDENGHELFYDRWDVLPQKPREPEWEWPLLTFPGSESGWILYHDGNYYEWSYEGFKLPSTVSPRGKVQQQWYGLNQEMWYEQETAPYWQPVNRTVRLCLTNKVATNRWFHLYIDKNREDSTYKKAKYSEFDSASSKYTITSPGTADKAFTVGSFASRSSFENIAASNETTTATVVADSDFVSTFSGQGPRVDQTNLREEDEYTYEEIRFEHVKPDFVCPGELVLSVLDRNVRDNNVFPPLYAFTNTTKHLWHRSQPYGSEYYIERKRDIYTNLNYISPLGIFGGGDFWKASWWSSLTTTDLKSESEQLGTSPASAFGAGSAILMLQAWPCFQLEELRRYMRPCEQTEFFPHNPGNYSIKRGFGNLHLGDIFLNNYYVDTETFLNYLSLVPNSETNIVIENTDTIWVTNNPVFLAGDYQSVYCANSFCLTNLVTGWSKEVDYVNLTNRAWWADNVVLSNYIKQEIVVCLDLGIPDGSTKYLDESIWVEHRHGLEPPTITIIEPTNAPSIKYDPPVDSFLLSGVWSDDSDIKTTKAIASITWRNNTTSEGGTVSNINIIGAGGTGTWDAGTISIENPSYNVITVTATDDDGDSSSDTITIDNGSRQFVVEKINFKVNLAKPGKDLFKMQGTMKNVATDALFEVGDEFYIGLVQTNDVVTNLFSFVTTADNIKAKGRKAIYLEKGADGHIFKVIASRKKNDDDIKLKIIMKKFDGLEGILEIDPVDAKKKDTPWSKSMFFKGKACTYIFNSSRIGIPYWGKLGKNIIGKK